MPGQPGQQPVPEMESIVAVLKFTSSVSSSDEEMGECEIEICDDPTATLVVHASSPTILEREETDSGIYDDAFEEGGNGGGGNGIEEELGDNWNPSLYTLQLEAPKPKPVHCKKELDTCPSEYSTEYHGEMQRDEAELLLGNECGRYLVRENPKGDRILSFMLNGRMYNYRLFYCEERHFVGEIKFKHLEDLVEDGLITLYLQQHNAGLTMQRGRVVVRRKSHRQTRLRRQSARRVKGAKGKTAYLEMRRSQSRSPSSSVSGDITPPVSSSPLPSPIPAHTILNFDEDQPSTPLTPNSDDVQSDLDLTPPTQRRSSLEVPGFDRQRSGCVIHSTSPLAERRAKSTNSLDKTKAGQGEHGSALAALVQSTSPLAQRRVKSATCIQREHNRHSSAIATLVQSTSPIPQRKSKSATSLTADKEGDENRNRYTSVLRVLKDAVKEDMLAEAKRMELQIPDNGHRGFRRRKANTYSLGTPTYASSKVMDGSSKSPQGYHSHQGTERHGDTHKGTSTLPPSIALGNYKSRHMQYKASPYYKAHLFKVHSYKGPTWCEICHHFLWGLVQQGMRCKDCGMDVHRQCVQAAMTHECYPNKKFVKRVYGVDLTTLVKLEGNKIPDILKQCIEEIESRDLTSEGIYRVSGQSSEILDLKEKYDEGETVDFSQYEDINIITGAVKLFFRDLPIPLISFDAYSALMKATCIITDSEDTNTDWQPLVNALKLLPKAHYNVLKFLAEHLHRIEMQENKMTAYNLAVVFSPTLMRPPSEDISLMKDFSGQRNFVEYVIRKHDVLFV